MEKDTDEGYVDCHLHLSISWFLLHSSDPFRINSSFKTKKKKEIVMRS